MALDHNRLIRDAARRHLAPLGVTQRGRSRTWIDDRGWWLITVEFQPSGSGRGTYLNVGGSWLWYPKDSNSFDLGYRVQGFRDLSGVDASQTCDELAQRAAAEVRALRMRFPDVEAAARELNPLSCRVAAAQSCVEATSNKYNTLCYNISREWPRSSQRSS